MLFVEELFNFYSQEIQFKSHMINRRLVSQISYEMTTHVRSSIYTTSFTDLFIYFIFKINIKLLLCTCWKAIIITLAFILFELFLMDTITKLCPLYSENCSWYLHETSYKYQSTLDNGQSTRTITLAFILFELFPLELCPSQNLVRSVT